MKKKGAKVFFYGLVTPYTPYAPVRPVTSTVYPPLWPKHGYEPLQVDALGIAARYGRLAIKVLKHPSRPLAAARLGAQKINDITLTALKNGETGKQKKTPKNILENIDGNL